MHYTKEVYYPSLNYNITQIHELIFTDEFNGFGVGTSMNGRSFFISTRDRGQNWNVKELGDWWIEFRHIYAINQEKIFLGGQYGNLWITEDGGESWIKNRSLENYDIGNRIMKFHFSDSLNGVVAFGTLYENKLSSDDSQYKSKLFITDDGGFNWKSVIKKNNLDFNQFHFFSDSNIIAVGKKGIIFKTFDFGQNWISLTKDSLKCKLKNVYFVDSSHGWICGEKGTILHTDNEGKNWHIQKSKTENNFNNLFFIDNFNGWCIGDNGFLLYTSNGGNDWLIQDSITQEDLLKVRFYNLTDGYLLSEQHLFKTTNGGQSWSTLVLPTKNKINDFYFNNFETGWLVGDGNIILYTENQGNSWNILRQGNEYAKLFSIDFNNNVGICVGYSIPKETPPPGSPPIFSKSIFISNDFGKSWNLMTNSPLSFDNYSKIIFSMTPN